MTKKSNQPGIQAFCAAATGARHQIDNFVNPTLASMCHGLRSTDPVINEMVYQIKPEQYRSGGLTFHACLKNKSTVLDRNDESLSPFELTPALFYSNICSEFTNDGKTFPLFTLFTILGL